jgi:hypothetical protein
VVKKGNGRHSEVDRKHSTTMSTFHDSASSSQPYKDPTPLPDSVPRVPELGVTSAPLKSAAFFIGAYCKEYNGTSGSIYTEMRSF